MSGNRYSIFSGKSTLKKQKIRKQLLNYYFMMPEICQNLAGILPDKVQVFDDCGVSYPTHPPIFTPLKEMNCATE